MNGIWKPMTPGSQLNIMSAAYIAFAYIYTVTLAGYRLNHLNITISYSAVLRLALAISKLNEVPIQRWIETQDNVDVSVGVRDIRSDHAKQLHHMFSVLVVKSRISPPKSSCIIP